MRTAPTPIPDPRTTLVVAVELSKPASQRSGRPPGPRGQHRRDRRRLVASALEGGTGSELRLPLGLSVVGGRLLLQVITLCTTPVVYLAMGRGRGLFGRLGQRRARRRLPAAGHGHPAE